MSMDGQDKCKGYGYVEFNTAEEAANCLRAHDELWKKHHIHASPVNMARAPADIKAQLLLWPKKIQNEAKPPSCCDRDNIVEIVGSNALRVQT